MRARNPLPLGLVAEGVRRNAATSRAARRPRPATGARSVCVDELVDAPRLEAALEPDVLGRRLHSARGGLACEAPARARYQSVLTVLPVAHEETRVELLPGRGRERSVDAVGEEARRPALVRSDLDHRLAADGLATLHGRRCGEAQQLRARVDVPLPADGGYRVAAGEQEAVARMRLRPHGCIGRRAIHHGDDAAAAAVRQLDDAAAVRLSGVHRQHDGKIGRELDQPRRIARRQLQVADPGVRRVDRVDREVRRAVHLLVGAHRAEAPVPGIGHARRDLEPRERHWRLLADGAHHID